MLLTYKPAEEAEFQILGSIPLGSGWLKTSFLHATAAILNMVSNRYFFPVVMIFLFISVSIKLIIRLRLSPENMF